MFLSGAGNATPASHEWMDRKCSSSTTSDTRPGSAEHSTVMYRGEGMADLHCSPRIDDDGGGGLEFGSGRESGARIGVKGTQQQFMWFRKPDNAGRYCVCSNVDIKTLQYLHPHFFVLFLPQY